MKCPVCGYQLQEGDSILVSAEVKALVYGSGIYEEGIIEYDLDELVQVEEEVDKEFKCPCCGNWIKNFEG